LDALSDVLRLVRLTGAVFLDAEFTAQWCIDAPAGIAVCTRHMPQAQHVVTYHLVTAGTCEVMFAGEAPYVARAHDLIVIPGGDAHRLGSDLAVPRANLARLIAEQDLDDVPRVSHGGGGAATRLVCGYLACDSALFKTLLAALPRLMIIDMHGGDARGQWLESSIRLSLAEYAAPTTGAGTVLAKLSELMFVEAIRRYVESLPPTQQGWLAGLRDRYVGRALSLLHSKSAHAWTVEELAAHVGLSRSALGERFTAVIGQPPMQYLARWRMQLAADLLHGSRRSMAAIAQQVGYDSEAAFSRAFKREHGKAPAAWRRARLASGDGDDTTVAMGSATSSPLSRG
jgi:AraC-like DNA-binding protein